MSNVCCNYEKTIEDLNRRLSVAQLLDMQHQLNSGLFGTPGWRAMVTDDMLDTAISDEFCEFIGSGVQWKWWGTPVDPGLYDDHNARIEITDVSFFFPE